MTDHSGHVWRWLREPVSSSRRWPSALVGLLLVDAALRVVLVLGGGQLFFDDEVWAYFLPGGQLADALAQGDLSLFAELLFGMSAHVGFPLALSVLGLALRGADAVLGTTLFVLPASLLYSTVARVLALILVIPSVGIIGLIYAVARRSGGAEAESFLAALLLSCSNALFFYARHVVPYDLALCLALLALWIGMRDRPGPARSFLTGVIAGSAVLTYYGYYLIAGVAVVHHWLSAWRSGILPRSVALSLAGCVAPPTALVVASTLSGHGSFLPHLLGFSTTITQGSFAEGWRLPWAYLWDSEYGLLAFWVAAMSAPALLRTGGARRRPWLTWLGLGILMYAMLAVSSSGLHLFVMYGRLTRQIVPFFALAAASGLCLVGARRPVPNSAALAGVGLLLAHTAWNFSGPLTQWFPAEFERFVVERYGDVRRDVSVTGPTTEATLSVGDLELEGRPAGTWTQGSSARFVLVNAQPLTWILDAKPVPDGVVVLSTRHPMQFRPYQYEGAPPDIRALFRTIDVSMQLIDTGAQ